MLSSDSTTLMCVTKNLPFSERLVDAFKNYSIKATHEDFSSPLHFAGFQNSFLFLKMYILNLFQLPIKILVYEKQKQFSVQN